MDASQAAGGYAAMGQAASSFITAWGNSQTAKIQANSANTIRAINNGTVKVVNERNAAVSSLQRWSQTVRNSRVMEAVENNQEALAVNFNRARDARTRQNFAANIRDAEQSGRMQAAAAASGVTGSVVDVLDQTMRLKTALQTQARDETEKQIGFDYNKQELAQRLATMDQLDHTLIFDNIQLFDQRNTLPASTANPFSAAIAGMGTKGIQASVNFFDALSKTDYGLGGAASSGTQGMGD